MIYKIIDETINDNILLIITLILFGSILLASYPILYLKYHRDLYENINIFNDVCYDNSISIEKNSNISIKNTFIWKIANILFDFNTINKNFKKDKEYSDETSYNDEKNIDFHKIYENSNNNNILVIYDKHVENSIAIIIFILLIFCFHCIYKYFDKKFIMNDIVLTLYLFIFLCVNIIFFSIILKHIMDLYRNTNVYNYIMLLKELDIILKEGKTNYANFKIINILIKYSNDENINIEEVTLNKSLIDELINLKDNHLISKKIFTNDNIMFTLENIDKMKKYICIETNQKIFKEIDKISRFIFVYIFLLFPLLYILSIILKKIYIYCLFITIVILIFSISIYNMYHIIR